MARFNPITLWVGVLTGCATARPSEATDAALATDKAVVASVLFDGPTLRVSRLEADDVHRVSAGAVVSRQGDRYTVRSPELGDRALAVEVRTRGEAPLCPETSRDAARKNSYRHYAAYEDGRLRVLRVDLEPGETSAPIFFIDPGFVYVAQPATLRFSSAEEPGSDYDREGAPIEVREHHYNTGEAPHRVRVSGQTPLRVLRFEVVSCRTATTRPP